MSNTGLDAATLARSLRRMAGDGSVEWVMEPIQSSVLRDIADMLDENDKLRDELDLMTEAVEALHSAPLEDQLVQALNVADKLRELAQRMWRLERFGCYGCRRECDAESCYASDCKEAVEIEQEMRALGIEVPQ